MCARSTGLDVSECIIFLFERGKNRFKNPKRKQENHEKPAEIKRAFVLRSKASPLYSVLILFYIFFHYISYFHSYFLKFPLWKITIANSLRAAIFAAFHYCVIHMLRKLRYDDSRRICIIIFFWESIRKKITDLSHLSARFFRYLGP